MERKAGLEKDVQEFESEERWKTMYGHRSLICINHRSGASDKATISYV